MTPSLRHFRFALFTLLGTVFVGSSVMSASAQAEAASTAGLSAFEIMFKVNTADMGDNVTQDIAMVITDKHGREKHQLAHSFRKRTGDGQYLETRNIMFFVEPEKMLDVGFLTVDFDNPEREDKQWIYLPNSQQTKRIAGNDKRLSFMGTDFSHADMAMRNLQNYHYSILREEPCGESLCWVIQGKPINEATIDEDGYTESAIYVRQHNFMVVKSINQLKQGGRTKTMDVLKLEKIDGIWVQLDVLMKTMKGDTLLSQTRMTSDNVKFHKSLADDIFTVRTMESGLKAASKL